MLQPSNTDLLWNKRNCNSTEAFSHRTHHEGCRIYIFHRGLSYSNFITTTGNMFQEKCPGALEIAHVGFFHDRFVKWRFNDTAR